MEAPLLQKSSYSNIPPSIEQKIGRCLHNLKNHPIEIIKKIIYSYFDTLKEYNFQKYDDFEPVVTTANNFDLLLIPKDHPARSKSDTYYVDENTVLRTHTSAHQNEILAKGVENFLVSGDVYRKDEIDRCHYPVFHQIEGVARVTQGKPEEALIKLLSGLVEHLFPGCEYRVNDDYFPFTEPSFEIEVKYRDNWLEILGCGVMHQEIVKHNNLEGDFLAFGLGIDRLAMVLFDIPDIRYLWSTHPRFLDQFKEGKIVKFEPYSELPNQMKDISFWIPENRIVDDVDEDKNPIKRWLEENDFYELIRENCGEIAEDVKLMDQFFHPKKQKHSRMYRITYSPTDPSLKDPSEFTDMCNSVQDRLRDLVDNKLDVELR